MSWISDLVPDPSTRIPLTQRSFVSDILPPILCYFATALLSLFPDTFALRVGLLPVTLWSTFRAVTTTQFVTASHPEYHGFNYANHGFSVAMLTISFRVIDFTFRREPVWRIKSTNSADNIPAVSYVKQTLLDAFDLLFNLRGHRWCWSKGLQLPEQKRPVTPTSLFALNTLLSALVHFVLFDCMHYSVQSFSPETFGSPTGGTIFDPSLPPVLRYFRSTIISMLSGLTIYCAIQTQYDVATFVGVTVLQQDPSQWPPLFDAPWASTSLCEFWSKRWHQLFRSCFIAVGSKPITSLVGRTGGILAAFLVSGILHDWGLWAMGRGTDFWGVTGFFLMMGIGIILEGMYKKVSTKRVEGWAGWAWTMCWVLGWANLIVEAWCRRGLVGSVFMSDSIRPALFIKGVISHISTCHKT